MSLDKFGRRRFMTQGVAAILPLLDPVSMSCVPCQPREVALSNRSTDTRAFEEIRRMRVDGDLNAVAWNADGSRLAGLSNFGGTVTLWDSHSWAVANKFHRYSGAYSANSLVFLPDNTLLTNAPIGRSPDPNYTTLDIFCLIQWNAETGQVIRYIPDLTKLPKELSGKVASSNTFVASRDGSLVAAISKGSNVLLFETQGWSVVQHIATPPTPEHGDFAEAVSISPDSKRVAIGTGFGYVHVYSVDDGGTLLSFYAFPDIVPPLKPAPSCSAVAFSPDGQILVTGRGAIDISETDDGWVRLWRIKDGRLVANLTGGESTARTAAWSPNGNYLAIGDDGSFRMWQISHMQRQAPRLLKKIRGTSYSIAFSSSEILAVSNGEEVVIYA